VLLAAVAQTCDAHPGDNVAIGQELVASQASSGRFDRRQPDPLLAGAARDRTVTA
jgi:hypothetical protein